MYAQETTEAIIGSAYAVANALGSGFLEKVYENALAHELQKRGFRVEQQRPVPVYYDQTLVGDYVADLLVSDTVLVELKAVKNIENIHTAQCIHYLKATGLPLCLLINFGNPRVQIKRIVNNTGVPLTEGDAG
jgi:GxxExxY protein